MMMVRLFLRQPVRCFSLSLRARRRVVSIRPDEDSVEKIRSYFVMSVTTFLVLIACLLIAAKTAGWLCQRIGIPSVLGQLLIGVLVGPSLLGWVHPGNLLDTFGNLGVILLMFIAGLETDMQQM